MDRSGFERWLQDRRLASGQQTAHYVRWVFRFLQLRGRRPPRETWQDTLTAFLEDLGGGRFEPWQLRQAAAAVTLYCAQYCVQAGAPVSPGGDTESLEPRGAAGERRGVGETARSTSRGEAGERRKNEPAPRRPPVEPLEAQGTQGGRETPRAVVGGRAAALAASDVKEASVAAHRVRVDTTEPVPTHAAMLAELERILRLRHYAASTQRTYLGWNRRFLEYMGPSGQRLPSDDDVQAFLSHLAVRARVSAATQNQAFHAVLFLCRHVLAAEVGDLSGTVRAREGHKLPVVLLPEETRVILDRLQGTQKLMLGLVYGAGLRLNELLTLRVKDLDFAAHTVTVRASKGDKDRVTLLPKGLVPQLLAHLEKVKAVHEKDLAQGVGEAPLPDALARKYPKAGREWGWQFVFPSTMLQVDETGRVRRWHVAAATVQRAMKGAVRRAGIAKQASVHSLRHSYATALLMKGVDIRRVQELMGHKSVETTMVYTHVLQAMAPDLKSPFDEL